MFTSMPDPILIGLTGFASAGKDTTYEAIYNLTDAALIVERRGFADKLKIVTARAFGRQGTDEQLIRWANTFKEDTEDYFYHGTLNGRQFLQNLGLTARERFVDTFWIDQVLPNPSALDGWTATPAEHLRSSFPNIDVIVITDLRFENEAQRIKELGGVIWRVERPGLQADGHASEVPLPIKYLDRLIDNSGDFEHLAGEVERALQEVGL